MKIPFLGLELTRTKSINGATPRVPASLGYYGLSSLWGGHWPWTIEEPFTGAWQRNMELRCENVLTYAPVYRCITIIANDIAKLNLRLVEKTADNIWVEVESPAFSPVLRRQNSHQTRQDFIKRWMLSKLINGNTYVLKERDNRGLVTGMYVLDPFNCYPYVSDDGAVFYQCGSNKLAGIPDGTVEIPASEIIHDRNDPLFHDLCGLSPIIACGLSARQALNSQASWSRFYANGGTPSGILQVPGEIDEAQAELYKNKWQQNYAGAANVGKVAILGGGLEFKPLAMNAVDQELISQLQWTAENVCTAFGVPPWMIGVGDLPNFSGGVEALNQQYYSQCLQDHIESIEAKLDEGLGLEAAKDGRIYGTEFDLADLLRMDTKTQYETYGAGIKNGLITHNEARLQIGFGKEPGGDSLLSQQQYYSLEALAKRDAKADPFAATPATPPPTANDNRNQQAQDDQASRQLHQVEYIAALKRAVNDARTH
jgi:HK97 family phage portal protein